jgi:hypothetical protein
MSKEKLAKSKVKKTPRELVFHFSFLPSHLSFVRKLVLLCSLLIANCSLLLAQDEGTRFIQRLTWSEDEYARRYEVVIEKEEGEGTYSELRRESTSELFIELSLSPAKYRCLVIPHNILTQPGEASEWVYIEVLAVIDPTNIELVHKIGEAKPGRLVDNLDIFLSAAWMLSFTVSDRGNRFFKGNMSLAGATVRFGVLLTESYFSINPGLELPVSYHFFHPGTGEQAHLLSFALNLTALKRFPGDRTALTFRLGAGYSVLFQTNIGASFMLFVTDNWYLETGLDYAHWFTSPTSYYLKPWVGIGFSK